MLKQYEKLRLVDENKNNELLLEVNWKDDPKISECKIIKLTFPSGEECYVKRESLMSVLFLMGTPEQQRKMIPQTLSKVRWYETVVSVRAKNDIAKGQLITFPIKLSLPTIQEEIIRETTAELRKQGKI